MLLAQVAHDLTLLETEVSGTEKALAVLRRYGRGDALANAERASELLDAIREVSEAAG